MIQANVLEGTVVLDGLYPMIASELLMIMESITNELTEEQRKETQEFMKDTIASINKQYVLLDFLNFLEPVIK